MSPPSGKRVRGGGFRGRESRNKPRVRFLPRPHIFVTVKGLRVDALIDSGSEVSLVNGCTVDMLRREGVVEQPGRGQILLVDGTPTDVPGTITIPLRVRGRGVTHTFTIVPEMESDLLLGVDAQAKLQLGTPPTVLVHSREGPLCGYQWTDRPNARGAPSAPNLPGARVPEIRGDQRADREDSAPYPIERPDPHQTTIPATKPGHAGRH